MTSEQEREFLALFRSAIGDPQAAKFLIANYPQLQEMIDDRGFLKALARLGKAERLAEIVDNLDPEEIASQREWLRAEIERDIYRKRLIGSMANAGRVTRDVALWTSAIVGAWYAIHELWTWFTGPPVP